MTTSLGVEAVYQEQLPRDINVLIPWLNVARRLRSAAIDRGTYSIVNFSVLVDETGNPVVWSAPRSMAIEPRSNCQTLDALFCGLGVCER